MPQALPSKKIMDLRGRQFGRLTVVEYAGPTADNKAAWVCKCACGCIIQTRAASLRAGCTTSCGCVRSDIQKQRAIDHPPQKGRLHYAWKGGVRVFGSLAWSNCRVGSLRKQAEKDGHAPPSFSGADLHAHITEHGKQCEICGAVKSKANSLCVDHDHLTGSLRGVLCSECNRGLGHFADNPSRMADAITYLKEKANA